MFLIHTFPLNHKNSPPVALFIVIYSYAILLIIMTLTKTVPPGRRVRLDLTLPESFAPGSADLFNSR
jgi:hypothetical protein